MNTDPFDPNCSPARDDTIRQTPKIKPVSDLSGEPGSLDELDTSDLSKHPASSTNAPYRHGAKGGDETDKLDEDPRHPDPITGEPGAHPLSTGLGAAGIGMAATVAGVVVGGPIGGAVGAIIGSLAGGYAGKAVGESVNPSIEDEHWREHHDVDAFEGEGYESYAAAYYSGYEGYDRYSGMRASFEEAEADIRADYERAANPIPWDKARGASRAAWDKAAGQHLVGNPISHPRPGERL